MHVRRDERCISEGGLCSVVRDGGTKFCEGVEIFHRCRNVVAISERLWKIEFFKDGKKKHCVGEEVNQ